MQRSKTFDQVIDQLLESYESNHQRKHKQLMMEYLIDQLGFDEDLAWMVVELHECSNLAETMNLFITDDEGMLQHYYVPQELVLYQEKIEEKSSQIKFEQQQQQVMHQQKISSQECRICNQPKTLHKQFLPPSHPKLLHQYQQYHHQKQQSSSSFIKSHIRSQSYKSHKSNKSHLKSQHSFLEQQIQNYTIDPLLFKKYSDSQLYEQKIEQSNNNKKCYCQICCVYFEEEEIVRIQGVSHQLCYLCMNQYLKEEIINRRIEGLGCPHCGQHLSNDFIRGIVSNVIFQKYETFLRNAQIQNNPNLRWCPNPKCSIVLHIKQNKKKKITCPKCSTNICGKCNRQYHPKQSCNAMFEKQIKGLENAKDIQKCRKCRALVEKISGCNHMTCTVCRYQWCWLCGSTYSSVHFSPFNPLGCAGLQNGHHSRWGKRRIYAFRILIFLLIIILTPIAIPLIIVFCGPALVIFAIWDGCYRMHCCLKLILTLLGFPLGFVIDPIVWIWAIIVFTPKICSQLCDWVQRRQQIHQTSQNNLRRRLIEQQQDIMNVE